MSLLMWARKVQMGVPMTLSHTATQPPADGAALVRRAAPDSPRDPGAGPCSYGHAPARHDRPSRRGALGTRRPPLRRVPTAPSPHPRCPVPMMSTAAAWPSSSCWRPGPRRLRNGIADGTAPVCASPRTGRGIPGGPCARLRGQRAGLPGLAPGRPRYGDGQAHARECPLRPGALYRKRTFVFEDG